MRLDKEQVSTIDDISYNYYFPMGFQVPLDEVAEISAEKLQVIIRKNQGRL